jgi:C4-dicarboxylate-specific signal transduction histidine kinase
VVVLVLVADYAVGRFVLRPLGRVASDARKIAGGEVGHRVQETGPREIRRLARTVNGMADRLVEDREELARNVASLQEVNRALTETRDELIQAEKLASVGRMAAGLAHEIGNPLNSVMTYVDVGRRRGVEGEWLDGIREEAGRIDEIIRALLDFARPGDPVVDRHDANEIVRETLRLLGSQGRFGDVEVEGLGDEASQEPALARPGDHHGGVRGRVDDSVSDRTRFDQSFGVLKPVFLGPGVEERRPSLVVVGDVEQRDLGAVRLPKDGRYFGRQ